MDLVPDTNPSADTQQHSVPGREIERLNIEFKHCYGIRDLTWNIDFGDRRAVAIYSPNGTMKTSFAKTFEDLATGEDTKDLVFPDRETVREITSADTDLNGDDVMVVLSYDENIAPTEAVSTLLVNPDLRNRYETLRSELSEAQHELVQKLKQQAETNVDVAESVSKAFTGQEDNFFEALENLKPEIYEQDTTPFEDVPYDVIFNPKVETLLKDPTVQSLLADYVTQLNELLEKSTFFSKGGFNFYNATKVKKSLVDHGFFKANHSVLFNGGGEAEPIKTEAELDQLIANEKGRITGNDALKKKLDQIEKKIDKNQQTRYFLNCISKHVELLPELRNIQTFEQKLWKSYIKAHEEDYKIVVDQYEAVKQGTEEIEEQAAQESTQWEHVINIFNDRFCVPFKLVAKNRRDVVMGQAELLELGFEFEEGTDQAVVERTDLLQVLSGGEKKALYILNVLFEIETRKSSEHQSLFIIDDLADSFDYKNKYAIVQYLKEMSDEPKFKLILLTHNFDFFRALQNRGVVGYNNCFMAQKSVEAVCISKASGLKNPFIKDFKNQFFNDGMKRVACIPFIRNILEYTKGEDDPLYLELTSLLHWKQDTSSITNQRLDEIFNETFNQTGSWNPQESTVYALVLKQADQALTADEGTNFENKIVLSIAVRFLCERHMINMLGISLPLDGIQNNQSSKLLKGYKEGELGDETTVRTLDEMILMTPENIHLNSFMYEPIIDLSDTHLRELYRRTKKLNPPTQDLATE